MKTYSEVQIKKIHTLFIYFLLFSTSIISFYIGNHTGYTKGFILNEKNEISKREIDIINYDAIDLNENINNILSMLSNSVTDGIGNKPSLEFQDCIDDICKEVIKTTANAYGLPRIRLQQALSLWSYIKEDEINKIFRKFQSINKQGLNINSAQTVHLSNYDAADDLACVLSDNLNTVIGLALAYTPVAATEKLIFKNLSKFLLVYIMRPVAQGMRDKGLVRDIDKIAEIQLKEYVENAITELATTETAFSLTSDKTYPIEFFPGTFVHFTSEAKLRIETYSIIKAGFPLHDGISIKTNHEGRNIIVTLPPARILTREFHDTVLDQENGVFSKITPDKHNRLVDNAHKDAERIALNNDILYHAEQRASKIINGLFGTWINLPGQNYQILVRFRDKNKNNNIVE